MINDYYDRAVRLFMASSAEDVFNAWNSPHWFPGGQLFARLGHDRETSGCPTQVAEDIRRAPTPELGRMVYAMALPHRSQFYNFESQGDALGRKAFGNALRSRLTSIADVQRLADATVPGRLAPETQDPSFR